MTLTKAGAGLGLSIVAAKGGAMPRWVMYWNQSSVSVAVKLAVWNFTKLR